MTLARCVRDSKHHKMRLQTFNLVLQSSHPNPTMNNQLAKRLLPAIALILSIPTLAAIVEARPHKGFGRISESGFGRQTEQLDLTAEQKTKMEQLQQSTRSQIEAILTPEQRQKFQQFASERQSNTGDRSALNLTAEQKIQLQTIRQQQMAQFRAVLTPEQQAQLQQGGMKTLELTAEQKTKMQQLKTATRAQMEAVLTPAQQQQAKAIQSRRQTRGENWQSLNLTTDQKTKIKAIRQSSQAQFKSILTPEQQSKLKAGRHGKGSPQV